MPGGLGLRRPPRGFRHFLGDPRERFRWRGADPRDGGTAFTAFYEDMARLARAMEAAPAPGERTGDAAGAIKPPLPSGYTYALQLIAHDLVDTTLPIWAASGSAKTSNAMARPLQLDTLYGGGPVLFPLGYVPDAGSAELPSAFRLGRFRAPADGEPPLDPPWRDIPRVQLDLPDGAARGLNGALLADERNDQHALLSQVTVLFMALHNAILGLLPPVDAADPAGAMRQAQARFDCARATTVLIYRAVLRGDILPQLLHPGIAELYGAGTPLLEAGMLEATLPGGGMPLEFSHGAFRFGHAMVRNTYLFRDEAKHPVQLVLRRNSHGWGGSFPQGVDWLVDWAQFLDLGGKPENTARPIAATSNAAFAADPRLGPMFTGRGDAGLALRDLMSGGLAGLWSAWSLMDAIAAHPAGRVLAPHFHLTRATAPAALAAWRDRLPPHEAVSDDLLAALADSPPLPFLVLLEAQDATAHAGLGALGSILVAETILGILARDELPAERAARDFPTQLRLTIEMHGQGAVPATLTLQPTLAGLVRFLASLPEWRAAQPPLFTPGVTG